MTYDYRSRKTVIVLASTLMPGQAANVIGHLALAIGSSMNVDDLGENPLIDASGIKHHGISKYPVIIVEEKSERLRLLVQQARTEGALLIADFIEDMLTTGHDDELSKSVRSKSESELNYLGIAIHGSAEAVKQLTGKLSLWGRRFNVQKLAHENG